MASERENIPESIKNAFKAMDKNNDGYVDRKELEAVFRVLDDWTEEEFERLFKGADKNSDGRLSIDEFVDWVMASQVTGLDNDLGIRERRQTEIEEQIKSYATQAKQAGMEWMLNFTEFDSDGDGALTLAEFGQALEKCGVQLSEGEAMLLFNERDWSHDGTLSIQEFKEFLEGKSVRPEEAPLAESEGTFQKRSMEGETESTSFPAGSSHGLARRGTALEMEDIEDF